MLGIEHEVVAPDVDESEENASDPKEHVIGLSGKKAEKVVGLYPDHYVLGVDTIVFHNDKILGKPGTRENAFKMLKELSGDWHKVYSGITLIDGSRNKKVTSVEVTKVRFRELSDWEIMTYAATSEPQDKAGAYAVQGYGATIVEKIDGCFYNVVGLPIVKLIKLLNKLSLEYRFGKLIKMAK